VAWLGLAWLGLAWLIENPAVNGKTASYFAAEDGHETVVQLLLKHMANVDAKDNDEWTARCI
jgi:hypothetical protein